MHFVDWSNNVTNCNVYIVFINNIDPSDPPWKNPGSAPDYNIVIMIIIIIVMIIITITTVYTVATYCMCS